MDDNKDLAPSQRQQTVATGGGLVSDDAEIAGVEPAATDGQSAQPGGEMSMPPLKRIVLALADLIEAQLTVNAGRQSVPVPGTDFTEEGVRLLLRELRKRSETPGAPGRFLAWWLLTYLTRSAKGEEAFVAGANLTRLRRLATGLERIRAQRPAAPTSAAAPPDGEEGADEDANDSMEWMEQHEDAIDAEHTAVEARPERQTHKPRSKPARRSKKTQEPPTQEEPAD